MSVSRIRAADWAEGMGESLRAGLKALAPTDHDAALVSLLDLPDVDAAVVAGSSPPGRDAATSRGRRTTACRHPVLLGRDHWARRRLRDGRPRAPDYLAAHDVDLVECGDLATGARRRPAMTQRATNIRVVA